MGPGSYELSATPARVEKPALKKNQVNSHERTKSSSLLTEQAERERRPLPGPGAYELQTDSHRRAALGLILREERFSSKGMQAGPGPGEYMRKRFVHLAPSNLQQLTIHNPFARPPETHPSFGTTERFVSR